MKKPDHIFLVHGEEEPQKVLKNKITENTGLAVTIPAYGETYDLSNIVKLSNVVNQDKVKNYAKLEVIDRMKTLKEELNDMESIVREDILANSTNDKEIEKINERIKQLERQIVEIIENK